MMQAFLRYAKNSGWLLGEQVFGLVYSLLIGVLIARMLGPEDYGLYVLTLVVLGLLLPISKLGMDTVLVRELLKYPEQQRELLAAAVWMRLLVAAFLVAGVSFVWGWRGLGDEASCAFWIASLGLFFHSTDSLMAYFQAKVQAKQVAVCVMLSLGLGVLVKLMLLFYGAGVFALLGAMLLDKCLLSVFLYRSISKAGLRSCLHYFKFESARGLLRDSWPLIFSGLIVMVYARIDQVMIGWLLGRSEVGYYGVGVRLSDLWLIVPTALGAALFPALSNIRTLDPVRYRQRLVSLYGLVMYVGFAVACVGIPSSKWLVQFIFGAAYLPASEVFNIRIWDTFFAAVGMLMGKWMHLEELQSKLVWFSLSGALINIALNAWWIPAYGINGAATASVVSVFMVVIIVPAFLPSTRAHVWLIATAPLVCLRQGFVLR